jgi:dimethylaniline monooxygenase (N-oxide forming)
MSSNKIAIIGAGPAGLSSAKHCKQVGLRPTIFEKANDIGGLWRRTGTSTGVWDGLITNISRYSTMFIDFPWNSNEPLFPTDKDMHNYLRRYCEKYGLNECLRLNEQIESVERLETTSTTTTDVIDKNKWKLNIRNLISEEMRSEVFDYLIVATGMHQKPLMPKIESMHEFKGIVMHSSQFKLDDDRLKSKRVAVVGNSISGQEISSFLVNHAKYVLNVFRRPFLSAQRLIKLKLDDNTYNILPFDLLVYNRSLLRPTTSSSEKESFTQLAQMLSIIFPEQTNKELSNPALYYDLSEVKPILIAISDNYYSCVKNGQIETRKSEIAKFDKHGFYLSNGEYFQVDAVVFCTGYMLNIDFFEKEIFEKIGYDREDLISNKIPHLLYKCTFSPNIENLAFIAQNDGLSFAGTDLQAKWASLVFTGKVKLPDKQTMQSHIDKIETRRKMKIREQFPYGNYLQVIDSIADEMNLLLDFSQLNAELFKLFWNISFIASQYAYKENAEYALQKMKEIEQLIETKYHFNDEESTEIGDLHKKISENSIIRS